MHAIRIPQRSVDHRVLSLRPVDNAMSAHYGLLRLVLPYTRSALSQRTVRGGAHHTHSLGRKASAGDEEVSR